MPWGLHPTCMKATTQRFHTFFFLGTRTISAGELTARACLSTDFCTQGRSRLSRPRRRAELQKPASPACRGSCCGSVAARRLANTRPTPRAAAWRFRGCAHGALAAYRRWEENRNELGRCLPERKAYTTAFDQNTPRRVSNPHFF